MQRYLNGCVRAVAVGKGFRDGQGQAMGRPFHFPRLGRFTGYDVVRIALGLLLLTAAGLKGYELASEPVAETGLLSSRWFLIGVVELELFFGLWLLAGLYPRLTWTAALLCFGGFAVVSLYKAISGETSCCGFGKLIEMPLDARPAGFPQDDDRGA